MWGDIINVYLIYQKYNKEFLAYARSITQNQDRAFDLVQEAYLSAIEKEDIFEILNEYQIKGWFFTAIKNKNIDYIRKYSRIVNLIENDNIEDTTTNFEEEIVVKELLSKIPEKYKKVLYLKYYLGLNSMEIGERLGISPSTVRSQLSVSLKILKENL